jgi:hypothetical protein
MTALSVPATSVSGVARGIAEAESVGTTANAQAAKPISSNVDILLEAAAVSRQGENVPRPGEFRLRRPYFRGLPFLVKINPRLSAVQRSRPASLSVSHRACPLASCEQHLRRFCRRGITITKFWRWSFALSAGGAIKRTLKLT